MVMANITPMGMLFVRCGNGGVSHHPSETLSEEDADTAVRVFEDFLRAVQHHTAPCCDGPGGRASVALIEAIYLASRTDRPVEL